MANTTVCNENINKQIVNIADETLTDYGFLNRYHFKLNKRIILKDDIEFVTEFPCFLGHPVYQYNEDNFRFPSLISSHKHVNQWEFVD